MLTVPDSGCADSVCASPNYGERVDRQGADCIILHYTGMLDGAAALAWLCDSRSAVSCHYLVEEDGRVVQLVSEAHRAWHAGRARWKQQTDINSASLGIEIANGGHDAGLPPFPKQQIAAVVALCHDLIARHSIVPERILAHSDVAPGRKQDPGERFPWAELFGCGVGHWVPERAGSGPSLTLGDQGPSVAAVQEALGLYGYGIESTGTFDDATRTVVAAFQRHFRPSRVDGVGDPETTATLEDLVHTLRPGKRGEVSLASGPLPVRA